VRHAKLSFGEPKAGAVDAALAALWCATRRTADDALWSDSRGWRLAMPPTSAWKFADRSVTIELAPPHADLQRDRYLARVGTQEYALRVLARDAQSLTVDIAGKAEHVSVIEADAELHLFRGGRHAVLRLSLTEDALRVSAGAEEGSLVTPLPGTLVAVHVTAGQQVPRGAPLVTVEAMKMEHTLTAPYAGTVTRVPFGVAERVAAGAVLVELSPLGV
jgi:3-methylcrotonyl-CoA carboxylase alpha subunit